METLELYHGTDAVFSAFDPTKLNSDCAVDQYGSGFYFYDVKDSCLRHGKNIITALCSIHKILDVDDTDKHTLTDTQILDMIMNSPELDWCLTNFADVDYVGKDAALRMAVSLYSNQDILVQLNTLGNDFYRGANAHLLLKQFKRCTGFNCIRKKFEGSTASIYVMLDENDIIITDVCTKIVRI